MKIALIIEHFVSDGGGAERSTSQIARELVGRGHEVAILSAALHPNREEPDFDHRPMCRARRIGSRTLVKFDQYVRRNLADKQFDTSLSMTTMAPARVLQPRSGTMRETQLRNVFIRSSTVAQKLKAWSISLSWKKRTALKLERQTLADPMVRRVLAVSRYVARQLEQHYKMDLRLIEVLPNAAGMPTVSDQQRAQWRSQLRDTFHIPDSGTVFLFAAHNPRLKGLDSLLRAAKLLADRNIAFTLLLAGKVGYGAQQRAAQLGIRQNVRIVGPTQKMAPLYCAADVTVLPSYYDPSSKVVIESLMMGTSAISTSYNGASDLIVTEDGICRGRVVEDPGDIVALAQAMTELSDPVVRHACSEATAGLAQQLSMTKHVDRLEKVLIEVAG
jgi:glycosyltransferase involved in cell wall biosynthesis